MFPNKMSGENKFSRFFGCIVSCGKKKSSKSKSDQPTKIQHNTSIQSHKINFTWTVDEFDFHMMNKAQIKSCEFWAITNNKSKWRLTIEPSYEILSIRLHYIPTCKDDKVLAKSDISIWNNQQKKLWKGEIPIRKFENTTGCGLSGISIKKKKISPTNKLTICCNLTYTKIYDSVYSQINSPIEPAPPRQLRVPKSEHLEKFASLYNENLFADIQISVEGTNYTAHKVILAAHSPVFAKMFEANAKKGRIVRINISGIDEQVIGEMLRYIYTGKCENLENIADGLLIAADRYGLNRLKIICVNVLVRKLSVENAPDLLILADERCINELKFEAIKFIAAKYGEVYNEEAWKNIAEKKPQLAQEVYREFCRQPSGRDTSYIRTKIL